MGLNYHFVNKPMGLILSKYVILAKKSPKNLFFGKIPKKWKNPTQKEKLFFYVT
jgi:hypothetical protein